MPAIVRFGAMKPGEVHVWSLDLAADESCGLTAQVLDEHERHHLAALRSVEERQRYGTAHTGLRVLLGAYLAVSPARVRIARTRCPMCGAPHGKPRVDDDHRLQFSLARSGDMVLFAFASTPVGIDVELVREDLVYSDGLRALHPVERGMLEGLNEALRPEAFHRCFVRKEAYLKGLGLGLAVDLDSLLLGFGSPPDLGKWKLTDLTVGADHAAALALRTEHEPVVHQGALRPGSWLNADLSRGPAAGPQEDFDERWARNA